MPRDMNTRQVAEQLNDLDDCIEALKKLQAKARDRCTHRDDQGRSMTRPALGGFAICMACQQEVD